MKKAKNVGVFTVCILLVAAIVPIGAETGSGPEIGWLAGVPQALESASRDSRPVLVDVWAVWCAPCKLMEEKVWSDPGIRDRMQRFVPLKVDADANEVFTARYDAEVLPATLFLDGEGRLITRLTGYVAPEMLGRVMDAVSAGYEEYMALVGAKDDLDGMSRLASYYLSCENSPEAARILRKAVKRARKGSGDRLESLELQLAETLLESESPEQGAKSLERLVSDGADPDTRHRARAALDRYRAGLE